MDIYGSALLDFYKNDQSQTLWLHNSYGETEEMPVDVFFREEEEMPEIELKAMHLCKGHILDIGAGVGSHALILQKYHKDVTAIDTSLNAVNIMKQRGVKHAFHQDVFTYKGKFDTLLLLMNGIGLTRTLEGLEHFFEAAKSLLNPKGTLIFDSSDISYLYEDSMKPKDKYFGEVSYAYEYKGEKDEWFKWLYIDPSTLKTLALKHGWNCKIIIEDEYDQYLAQLTLH